VDLTSLPAWWVSHDAGRTVVGLAVGDACFRAPRERRAGPPPAHEAGMDGWMDGWMDGCSETRESFDVLGLDVVEAMGVRFAGFKLDGSVALTSYPGFSSYTRRSD
jgi:hypothetical protein